jgi:hypothetical protein
MIEFIRGAWTAERITLAPAACGGDSTTLKHYADPVPEVDRKAAAYLAELPRVRLRETTQEAHDRQQAAVPLGQPWLRPQRFFVGRW